MQDIINSLPPSFLMIAGGFLMFCLPKIPRQFIMIALPILVIGKIINAPLFGGFYIQIANHISNFLFTDSYSKFFAIGFSLATLMGGFYALQTHTKLKIGFAYIYAGAAIGICFAGDFLVLLIYSQVMAVSSAIIILHAPHKNSYKVATRYLITHIFSGILLFAGIAGDYYATGSYDFFTAQISLTDASQIFYDDIAKLSSWLVFISLMINIAVPPFSFWLVEGYPAASPAMRIFLVACTTKAGIFILMKLFPGENLLIYIGFVTALFGLIFTFSSKDFAKAFSYSLIAIIGTMMIGIGVGTEISLQGVAILCFSHIIYSSLLFMLAGANEENKGRKKVKPNAMKFFIFIAFSTMIGIPLTISFIGKSLVSEAMTQSETLDINFYFMTLSALTIFVFFYTAIRFWQSVDYAKKLPMLQINQIIAMSIAAVLCLLPGLDPMLIYKFIYEDQIHNPLNSENIFSKIQIMFSVGLLVILFMIIKDVVVKFKNKVRY
jgi:multicomponent Na+:H+ antiporter subunit D